MSAQRKRCLAVIRVGGALLLAAASALAQESAAPQAGEPAAAPASRPAPEWLDLRKVRPVTGDAAAAASRTALCAACHGAQGTAIAPLFPNLAGQREGYLYREMLTYHRGVRTGSAMTPLAATLSDTDMRDLAAYYAHLAPAAPAATQPAPDPALLARGEALFLRGDPARGIPPCQGCHGADARGHPLANQADRGGYLPYALFPALRGQQPDYLKTKLMEFRDPATRHDSTTDFLMAGVGQRLDAAAIESLAAWLASLAP